ncbi:ribonuclease HII [Pseudoscourfieldia marina]
MMVNLRRTSARLARASLSGSEVGGVSKSPAGRRAGSKATSPASTAAPHARRNKAASSPPARKQKLTTHAGAATPSPSGLCAYERRAFAKGDRVVVGVDEAGRGPLCGPVVAAAVAVDAKQLPAALAYLGDDAVRIDDSKKLNEQNREELYERIVSAPGLYVARSFVDAKTIDEINILQATLRGMRDAVKELSKARAEVQGKVDHVFIDGNKIPSDMPEVVGPKAVVESVVGGDGKVWCIAAASIVAKVERDRYMRVLHDKHPVYNLGTHKGYGTAQHMRAIHEHGPIDEHRRSFAPIKGVEKWARK